MVFGLLVLWQASIGTAQPSSGDRERVSFTPEQEAARDGLVQAIATSPHDAAAYSQLGLLHDVAGDPRCAVAFIRAATVLAPASAARYDELGHVLRRAAVSVDAHLQRLGKTVSAPVRRVPGDEDACWRREHPDCFGLEHYTAQQLHIAEQDFLRRVQRDSSDSRGFQLLAQLYRNRSTAACTTAIRLQPTRPTAYLTLARVLPKGSGLGLYRRALALLPSQAEGYQEMGGVLSDLRYYGQANTAYRTAISLKPSSGRAYEALARLRLKRGRAAEAFDIAYGSLATHQDAPHHDVFALSSEHSAARSSTQRPDAHPCPDSGCHLEPGAAGAALLPDRTAPPGARARCRVGLLGNHRDSSLLDVPLPLPPPALALPSPLTRPRSRRRSH